MAKIVYVPYSGAGNTFLIFDGREGLFAAKDRSAWSATAMQHQVDGLLFLENSTKADFKMRYLNADGGEEAMCGNGIRCLADYIHRHLEVEVPDGGYSIETKKGLYRADPRGTPRVLMTELYDEGAYPLHDLYPEAKRALYLNTGVAHCVYEVENVATVELVQMAPAIRHHARFPGGTNVNVFEKLSEKEVRLRTFERGVEGETLACGTGAVATAIACHRWWGWTGQIVLHVAGGELVVELSPDLSEVWLLGPVSCGESASLGVD
jgi:diaminopimelate epimerase